MAREKRPVMRLWFEFASTYSWLSVCRIRELARAADVTIEWQPFLLGPIFKAKGWSTSPFVLDPVKGAYMWRDLSRRAARLGHRITRPVPFPQNSLTAARIMTAARREPWAPDFAAALMTAEFTEGADISVAEVLASALEIAGARPDDWLGQASDPAVKSALRGTTEEAAALGIFGAPSCTVSGELFWGDDRLEDALDYALAGGGEGRRRGKPV